MNVCHVIFWRMFILTICFFVKSCLLFCSPIFYDMCFSAFCFILIMFNYVLRFSALFPLFLGVFSHFQLCHVPFSVALLSWTGQSPSPERSLRNSGSMLPLLLPAVSRAYKQAGVCVCVCMRVHICVFLHEGS